MKDKILKIITGYSNYSFEEIKHSYKYLDSFDQVLLAIKVSSLFNISLDEANKIID